MQLQQQQQHQHGISDFMDDGNLRSGAQFRMMIENHCHCNHLVLSKSFNNPYEYDVNGDKWTLPSTWRNWATWVAARRWATETFFFFFFFFFLLTTFSLLPSFYRYFLFLFSHCCVDRQRRRPRFLPPLVNFLFLSKSTTLCAVIAKFNPLPNHIWLQFRNFFLSNIHHPYNRIAVVILILTLVPNLANDLILMSTWFAHYS